MEKTDAAISSLNAQLQNILVHDSEEKFASTEHTTFEDLPVELHREIFEFAARLDGRCAFRLTQVARYVHVWIQPILYERVVLRSPEAAKTFIRTLRSKPFRYFEPLIKSLAFDSSIPTAQAKPILVECSKRLILLSIFREGDSPGIFMPFISSPILRRLTLVERGPKSEHPRRVYKIRPEVYSSLTHLVIVSDLHQSLWDNLSTNACIRPWGTPENEKAGKLALQSLTHLAVTVNAIYGEMEIDLIRQVAEKLRYLALLEPSNIATGKHEQLLMFLRAMDQRFIVLIRDMGSADSWQVDDCFRPSQFWTKVENLVDSGYVSDRGDRWLPLRYSGQNSDAFV
ncbi:hypothetical protein CPB84DRAFT_1905429 [Gymnopilus junonius]|uniref:Uncharacterized protein n=1 Tax=Gymnopilus junonius TaxID=109634 RepID=A0A9P5TQ57_GYMJU|nr:hypothetical protein CPB84DRAFT_1905429 [Gymnopilus junonius]